MQSLPHSYAQYDSLCNDMKTECSTFFNKTATETEYDLSEAFDDYHLA